MSLTLAELHNNPFNIQQSKPSKWRGLVGMYTGKGPNDPNYGLLKFDTVVNGARAGFINLIQQVNMGRNTIEKIFDTYASQVPAHKEAYRSFVSKQTGIPRMKVIQDPLEILGIGKAIIKMEAGKFWVSPDDFKAGLDEAFKSYQLKKVAVVGGSALGILFILVVAYFIINR